MRSLSSRYSVVVALVLCFALLAAACASDGSDGADSPSAETNSTEAGEATDAAEPAADAEPTAEPAAEAEPTVAAEPADDAEPTAEPAAEEQAGGAELRSEDGVAWQDCDGVECATLAVPVSYDDPGLGTIDIAMTVHRATGVDDQWLGYLLVNPGGPGGSGLDMAQSAADGGFTEPLLEHYDIVGFDPRGVGLSEPAFTCGDGSQFTALSTQIDDVVDTDAEIAIGEEIASLCVQEMGPVGNELHTANVVRDMDEIRLALGADQISYYGASYGSVVGVWYATLFPDSVQAMVVDGADNPIKTVDDSIEAKVAETLAEAGAFEAQLAIALAACADDTCPIYNNGDPAGYLALAAEKSDLVTAAAPTVSPVAALFGLITPLYQEARWPELYNALFQLVENDDGAPLAAMGTEQLGQVAGETFTEHVNCLDDWLLQPEVAAFSVEDPDDAAEVDRLVGEALPLMAPFIVDTFEACGFLGELAPDQIDTALDGSDVPILVIGNTSDPATPFVDSQALAQDVLSNGYLLQVDHASHIVYFGGPNQCVNGYVEAMLVGLSTPPERLVECAREDAAQVTVEDLPLLMAQVCAEVAIAQDAAADPGAIEAACTEVIPAALEQFGDEPVLRILTGQDADQDRLTEFVQFMQAGLADAGIG